MLTFNTWVYRPTLGIYQHERKKSVGRPSVLIITASLCSESIFQAQGPISTANSQILLNALGIMPVIVVPTIIRRARFAWWFRASNTRARARLRLPAASSSSSGRSRSCHSVSRRRDLDRRACARSLQADQNPGAGRLAGLEMAVRLSRARGRKRERSRGARQSASAFLAHVGERDEHVLCAAARQHRPNRMNGMVTQLWLQADQTGELYGQSSRRRFCRHELCRARGPAGPLQQWVAATHGAAPRSTQPVPRAVAAEPERGASGPIYRSVAAKVFSTTSPIRNSRRAQVRRRMATPPNGRRANVFGETHLGCRPLESAESPLVAGGVVIVAPCCRPLGRRAREAICRICGTNGSPASITSVSASCTPARAVDAAAHFIDAS